MFFINGYVSSAHAQNSNTSVTKMFNAGEKLFNQERFKEATGIFSEILNKYPEHNPTIILYGRSAFRLSKFEDAVSLFSRVPLGSLNARIAYEYGYAAYSIKNWELGLNAFEKVPEGHSLADLANYYGAVCAIKLRKYTVAQGMLEKASVLPESLVQSRDIYLKHLEELRILFQKENLRKEKKKEMTRIKLAREKEKERKKVKKKLNSEVNKNVGNSDATPTEVLYTGDYVLEKSAEIKTYNKNQFSSNSGYSNKTSTRSINSFEFQSGFQKQLVNDRNKSSFGIQGVIKIEDEKSDGREQRVIIFEDEEIRERVITEEVTSFEEISSETGIKQVTIGKTDEQNGRLALKPWYEHSIGPNDWFGIQGNFSLKYPDFKRGQRSGVRGGKLFYYSKLELIKAKVSFDYSDLFDAETKPTTTSMIGSLLVSGEFPLIKWQGELFYKDFRYYNLGVEGPNSSLGMSIDVVHGFPLGMNLGGVLGFEHLTDYYVYYLEDIATAVADANLLTAKIYGKITPFSWLKIEVSQTFQSRNWQNIEPSAAPDLWEQSIANYIEEFTWSLALFQEF